MSIKDITVVLTSFKSDEKVRKCLNSIDKECSIINVENSNNAQYKTDIESEYNNVTCILAGDNLGYGKANNIGLNNVKTKYALILNPDTELSPTTFENFFIAVKQKPNFAIISPYAQEQKDKKESIRTTNLTLIPATNVKGFGMFLNLAEFKKVGFFDEDFFIYFEEIDLCKRLKDHKKEIYLAPSIIVHHSGGQSHNSSINNEMELSRNWHWMWSTFNYHKKHKGFLFALMKISNKLFSGVLKLLFYLILFNSEKRNIYYQRCSGIINAIRGNKSWYRPKV